MEKCTKKYAASFSRNFAHYFIDPAMVGKKNIQKSIVGGFNPFEKY